MCCEDDQDIDDVDTNGGRSVQPLLKEALIPAGKPLASCMLNCGHLLPSLTVSKLPFQVGLLIGEGLQLPLGIRQLLLFAGDLRLDLSHLLLPVVLQHSERQRLESESDHLIQLDNRQVQA